MKVSTVMRKLELNAEDFDTEDDALAELIRAAKDRRRQLAAQDE